MALKIGDTVQVNIISDKEMLRIGKEHKNKDYPTDVLTFNYGNKEELKGEIYINLDKAIEQGKENSISTEQEVAKLAEHAFLHMQGIHHKGDE